MRSAELQPRKAQRKSSDCDKLGVVIRATVLRTRPATSIVLEVVTATILRTMPIFRFLEQGLLPNDTHLHTLLQHQASGMQVIEGLLVFTGKSREQTRLVIPLGLRKSVIDH